MLPLFGALGLDNLLLTIPDYGAYFSFEVYQQKEEYYIKLFLNNKEQFPSCLIYSKNKSLGCSLDVFFQLYIDKENEQLWIDNCKNYDEELLNCNPKDDYSFFYFFRSFLFFVFFVFLFLVLQKVIFLKFLFPKKVKRKKFFSFFFKFIFYLLIIFYF